MVRDTVATARDAEVLLPHVFDRFWRVDKSRARHTGGSGLGLAIVTQVARLHGGTVTATRTPGTGSTFTLRLPTRTCPAPPDSPPADHPPATGDPATSTTSPPPRTLQDVDGVDEVERRPAMPFGETKASQRRLNRRCGPRAG